MPHAPVQFGAHVVRTHCPSGGVLSANALDALTPVEPSPASTATPVAAADEALTNVRLSMLPSPFTMDSPSLCLRHKLSMSQRVLGYGQCVCCNDNIRGQFLGKWCEKGVFVFPASVIRNRMIHRLSSAAGDSGSAQTRLSVITIRPSTIPSGGFRLGQACRPLSAWRRVSPRTFEAFPTRQRAQQLLHGAPIAKNNAASVLPPLAVKQER